MRAGLQTYARAFWPLRPQQLWCGTPLCWLLSEHTTPLKKQLVCYCIARLSLALTAAVNHDMYFAVNYSHARHLQCSAIAML
jgi:hypothetical protein